jgi:FtsP/CotA-like multicopper oxidase with cupredoxin domain
MVVAVIALIAALAGTAVAAKRIQLPKNSVGARQLKRKAVTTGKLANNAVNGRKVANNSLTGADINLGALGTVPAATEAAHAGDANTISGHSASCPAGTTLIRGVCFDSVSNGPASNLKSATEACAAKGGYLPTPMQLYSVKGILNLGTGVGSDQQLTDAVYADDGGGTYWTITVDGSGALERQEISNPGRYFCVYPLIR